LWINKKFVYYYKCGLCDADYVGFTSRHLPQRVEEHKRSTIGNHVKDQHGKDPETINNNFEILKKSQSNLDCLIFEVCFIRRLKPKLNKQSDSIHAGGLLEASCQKQGGGEGVFYWHP